MAQLSREEQQALDQICNDLGLPPKNKKSEKSDEEEHLDEIMKAINTTGKYR